MVLVYLVLSLWIGSGVLTVVTGRFLMAHRRYRDLHA